MGLFDWLRGRPPQAFWAAVLGHDGRLSVEGRVDPGDLAPEWEGVLDELLEAHGPRFRAPVSPEVPRIELDLDSADGAALGAFYAGGELATSVALLSGRVPAAEERLLAVFRATLADDASSSGTFDRLPEVPPLERRPVSVIVHWRNPRVSQGERVTLAELEGHLAAAFFRRVGPPEQR